METFTSWLKTTLLTITVSTILILLLKYVLKNDLNILRIVLTYIVILIYVNILWLEKRKIIKFSNSKYATFTGILQWGIAVPTLINIVTNNPFNIRFAVTHYIVYILGSLVIGIFYINKDKRKYW